MPAIILLALLAAVLAVGPLVTIWWLNTLFGLGIAYTFKTWLAALLFGMTAAGVGSANNRRST